MPTLVRICGGGGTSLSDLGFKNVPEGDWVLKSTAFGDTFPGYGSNIIPLVVESMGASAYINYGTAGNGRHYHGYAKINNRNAVHQDEMINGDGEILPQVWAWATGYNLFIPAFYDYDLSATQAGTTDTSIKITAWLQKQ